MSCIKLIFSFACIILSQGTLYTGMAQYKETRKKTAESTGIPKNVCPHRYTLQPNRVTNLKMAPTSGARLGRNETSNNRDSENRDYTVYGFNIQSSSHRLFSPRVRWNSHNKQRQLP